MNPFRIKRIGKRFDDLTARGCTDWRRLLILMRFIIRYILDSEGNRVFVDKDGEVVAVLDEGGGAT